MFYSHQLLARKAPLGQIWMAATLNNKIKRRNLEKLNIPLICEEILNPSIPMALRLSGILMGGVVNVYKRKVDFLYDDVNRFLEELNRVFRAKNAVDACCKTPAKRKAQPRSEAAATITDKENIDPDKEQHTIRPSYPSFDVSRFQKMTLEDLDYQYINIDIGDDDLSVHRQQHHQANPADITLPDKIDFDTVRTVPFDLFDRFDMGDETFTEADFTSQVLPDSLPQVPPSPPMQEPLQDDGLEHKQMDIENQVKEEVDEEAQLSNQKEADVHHPIKRKARRVSSKVIIDGQTMIPSETYHSWLNDASDIRSLGRKRAKPTTHLLRSIKIDTLMDLPPLCLLASSNNFLHKIHYPEPLMELWRKSTIGNPKTPPIHQRNTPRSFSEELLHQDSIEILRHDNFDFEQMVVAPGAGLGGFTSSDSRADDSQPIHSSGASRNSLTSGRSSKRQNSLPTGNLDTVDENLILPSLEPLEETGPAYTPIPHTLIQPAFDRVTESIRKQLKSHFDTPGNSQSESLNLLADGLTRKRAAQLFYHTCVMATMDYVKVEQSVPYGDISISRGAKM